MMKHLMMLAMVGLLWGAASHAAAAQDTGVAIYTAKCQMCHGPTGHADTPAGKALKAHPFNTPDYIKASDESLLAILKSGKNKMPAFTGKLTESQMTTVLAYTRTLEKN